MKISMATKVVRIIGKIIRGRKTVVMQFADGRILVVSRPLKR